MNVKASLAFVDTNILLYAHDRNAGDKQVRAAGLLASLWDTRSGVLSPQVLQEFFVNVTRKLSPPVGIAQAREIVRTYSLWVRRDSTPADILRASEIMELTGYSFWDSLILAAAEKAGAEVLYSEDMQHGQRTLGLAIVNPFAG
ncbi:PIN domain-containing protein [Pseudothauera rhizosphaerae]|uniref:PIN domain-containing protein n=1 Tax=Pseudothauera rhizosphaerae TaxID=2565932 RepID=A0A4S4AZ35_9RHOO|nr:PIN domain-containing protein [Pseudothauera rhizosphaerae]THF65273.1 PIN domain-containing protein [Pseudothauera rhizosphaerae]